jgi:hypothetical protein
MKYEKGNFFIVPNKEKLKTVGAVAQSVFMWLCVFADEKGQCYPSASTLAELCLVGENRVRDSIKKLVVAGLVDKQERKENGSNLSNLYQILSGGGGSVAEVGVGLPRDTNYIHTNYNKDMSAHADAFEQFWSEYPKKELKKKAKEIWVRKKLDEKVSVLMAFVKKAKTTERWLKGYIKQPTTFLNGECWNDDLVSYGTIATKRALNNVSVSNDIKL